MAFQTSKRNDSHQQQQVRDGQLNPSMELTTQQQTKVKRKHRDQDAWKFEHKTKQDAKSTTVITNPPRSKRQSQEPRRQQQRQEQEPQTSRQEQASPQTSRKQQQPQSVIVKTVVVHERQLPVYKCSQSVQMRFLRRVFCINFVQFVFVLSLTFLSTRPEFAPYFVIRHTWIWFILVPVVVLVTIVYFMGRYDAWSRWSQAVMQVLTTLTITAVSCLLSGFFDAVFFVRVTALFSFVIFSLGMSTLQPCFKFSTIFSSLYAVATSAFGVFVLVYQPHQALIQQQSIRWVFSAPEDSKDTAITFLIGTLASLYYIYGIRSRIYELFPEDWLCASFYVFCDGVYGLIVMVRAKRYFCESRRGGGGMDGVVDAVSLIV